MEQIPGNVMTMLDANLVVASKDAVRRFYAEETIDELGKSFVNKRPNYPILVRPLEGTGKYELMAGSRRLRAMLKLGMSKVPTIIISDADSLRSLEIALTENIQREDLTPFEEAWALLKFVNEYKLSIEEISKRIGKSTVFIRRRLKLLSLPEEVQKMVAEKKLNIAEVDALVALNNPEEQLKYARMTLEHGLTETELDTMIKQDKKGEEVRQVPKKLSHYTAKRVALKIIGFTRFLDAVLSDIQSEERIRRKEVLSALFELKKTTASFMRNMGSRKLVYPTWEEAGEAARKLGISSMLEYHQKYRQDKLLPSSPWQYYKNFPGYPIFFGKKNEVYVSWQEASAAAKKLGIKGSLGYQMQYKQDPRLPSNPQRLNGFPGWRKFLGKE